MHYIDNNLTGSHLNDPGLHLNRAGDRLLGKNLCTYLKSIRQWKNYNSYLYRDGLIFFTRDTNHPSLPPSSKKRWKFNSVIEEQPNKMRPPSDDIKELSETSTNDSVKKIV